ncbi:MAG TPA: TolC family protein [Terriglobales bacterium]|nr:TolC family protein [Terriglobales bacterium]
MRHKRIPFACLAVACVLANTLLLCRPALGQAPAPTPQSSSSSYSGGQSSNASQSGNPGAALSQSPFSGSVPEGKPTAEVLPLSFKDAIDRGLRNNLGLLLQSDTSLTAQGEKWKELSELLPHVSATVSQSVEQIDLPALGFRLNFPGIPTVIGPVGVFQSGVYLTQSVFDYHAIERKRGASYNERAALYNLKNARDLVVLAVGNSYLVALAGSARVDTAQADVETAQALYDKAADQQKAGTIPAIDALRAHVELQSRQQQLIVARNDYAKQKLTLGRVIGLPPGQEFSLTTAAPYEPLTTLPLEQDLQRAYASRPDYLAAAQQVRSSEEFRRAATAEYYPSLGIAGDYGAAGIRPGSSHNVYEVGATLNIPIFAGGRTHADVLEAEATLRQSRQQLENLRGQIDYEVRSARLDLNAAADQVEVARSSVDLANQTLEQARDRFSAGVTDNLEVVQAQDALTSAKETYISALYSHNLAKIELAKAVGFAEEGVKQYLQNQK